MMVVLHHGGLRKGMFMKYLDKLLLLLEEVKDLCILHIVLKLIEKDRRK